VKQNGTVASSGKILCLSVFAAQVFEDFLFSCVRVCLFVCFCVRRFRISDCEFSLEIRFGRMDMYPRTLNLRFAFCL
jgi:hypothetical protein